MQKEVGMPAERGKMEGRDKHYRPSRGIERACGGILESVHSWLYTEYMELAGSCVGRDWDEKQQKNLCEAIKLNLINRKEYPFEVLQRKYGLPCSQKLFRKESRKFIRIFSGLCGFE